ncbi:uncharacterized protein K460DRAFT_403130 [Cucurbitaria berberidis CBS 394.84]|uniref:Uncharacterized protein n=1 Tax=Cucurbitaria berberidis CBS 394.84 TaxID=1168544 RepID=A0A9P4GMM0_9PLEO|nr:uncharacterized protein K460DRAFT_403130 [Cucurbitaria berberidis CBS 394.84]KAF1847810.1 hypothetical protein K460DRAFT_403130 [Cucurbitaria berberidis CBS 394.84]
MSTTVPEIPLVSKKDIDRLKALVETHKKVISKLIVPICATVIVRADIALEAIVKRPTQPSKEDLETNARIMEPKPRALELIEYASKEIRELLQFHKDEIEDHPPFKGFEGFTEFKIEQKEFISMVRQSAQEIFERLIDVDEQSARLLNENNIVFNNYLYGDFSSSEGFLSLIEGWIVNVDEPAQPES